MLYEWREDWKRCIRSFATWYDASVSYLTYDVTPLLKSGTNTIGVALGNGRYLSCAPMMVGFGLPRLMAQLNIEYDNGETVSVVSDDSWKATNHGPITANNEFDGEHYDARLELGKWTESGYDDSGWQLAERMEAPKGKLVAQLSPSLKVMEEIKPISVKSVGDGRYIVDMGQNNGRNTAGETAWQEGQAHYYAFLPKC